MAQYQNVPMEGQYIAPTRQLNDQQLSQVAQAIGSNYELLAYELGIKRVELDGINRDNDSFIMKNLGMLQLWQRKEGERATMDVLCNAISRKRSVVNIDDAILKAVIADMSPVVSLH